MKELPNCPKCDYEYTYEDGNLIVCPNCSYEWIPKNEKEEEEVIDENIVRDAYGTKLEEGDSITIIKDLKVKGASSKLKVGTKVKNIRLIDGDHNIACKIKGFGAMNLKSEFVKKA